MLAPAALLAEADTAAADPFTTAGTVTVVAGRYYEVEIECANVTVTTVILPGTVPLTEIVTHIRGTLTRLTVLGGIATAGGTGTVTVDFSGPTTGAVVSVIEWTGHDAATPYIAANVQKTDGSDAAAPTDISLVLPNALTRPGNAVRLAAVCNANAAWTPGADFLKLVDAGYSTPTRRLGSQYDIAPADLVADGSFAAATQWAAAAWEVNEAAGGAVTLEAALAGTGTVVVDPALTRGLATAIAGQGAAVAAAALTRALEAALAGDATLTIALVRQLGLETALGGTAAITADLTGTSGTVTAKLRALLGIGE